MWQLWQGGIKMKERDKVDTPRRRIKWENPKLVKLNKAEQADGNNVYVGEG